MSTNTNFTKDEIFYVEEIFEDSNSCIDSKSNPQSNVLERHSIQQEEWEFEFLSSCPKAIGGGVSFTKVESDCDDDIRLFTFGGCDRHGNISSSVNIFHLSKISKNVFASYAMISLA